MEKRLFDIGIFFNKNGVISGSHYYHDNAENFTNVLDRALKDLKIFKNEAFDSIKIKLNKDNKPF